MTLSAQEFLRRFLLHVLPRGFVRIRSFGFLANRRRATLLPLCQRLLLDNPRSHAPALTTYVPAQPACFRCPKCATPMGRASSSWLIDGFLNRERSIPFLTLSAPPLIRDKNRMR